MLNPWIFGDEYIYISKARNIHQGIDVLADTSLGHKYPPLYSYLLSVVIGSDPDTTYSRIQWLNLAIGQVMLAASLFLLNKLFKFTRTKQGRVFLLFCFVMIALLPAVSGYYLVAMSENLFIPLILLIFSLLVYLEKTQAKSCYYLGVTAAAFSISLAILTRSAGVTIIPAFLFSAGILSFFKHKHRDSQRWQRVVYDLLLILILIAAPYFLVKKLELAITSHSEFMMGQKTYALSAYTQALTRILSGKNLFGLIKIMGNQLVYLTLSCYFFPILFFINEWLTAVKDRKLTVTLVFLTFFSAGTYALSVLHSYKGFAANPIKYSTYSRYLDPTVVLFVVFGLIKLWDNVTNRSNSTPKLKTGSFVVFVLLCTFLALMLPSRDFYITINSLGWGWLDIFQNNQALIKPVIIGFIALTTWILSRKKHLWPIILGLIIAANLFFIRVNLNMHQWLSAVVRDNLEEPLNDIGKGQDINRFYLTEKTVQEDTLNYAYYIKYRLLFKNNQFIPAEVIPIQDVSKLLNKTGTSLMVVARSSEPVDQFGFDQVIPVNDQIQFAVKNSAVD